MLQYALFCIHTSATDPNDVLKRNCKDFKYSYYVNDATTISRNIDLKLYNLKVLNVIEKYLNAINADMKVQEICFSHNTFSSLLDWLGLISAVSVIIILMTCPWKAFACTCGDRESICLAPGSRRHRLAPVKRRERWLICLIDSLPLRLS